MVTGVTVVVEAAKGVTVEAAAVSFGCWDLIDTEIPVELRLVSTSKRLVIFNNNLKKLKNRIILKKKKNAHQRSRHK